MRVLAATITVSLLVVAGCNKKADDPAPSPEPAPMPSVPVKTVDAAPPGPPAVKIDEAALEKRFDDFIASIDRKALAKDNPRVVVQLKSGDPKQEAVGLKVLSSAEALSAIPWVVERLASDDQVVASTAAMALDRIIATRALKRRNRDSIDVLIEPLAEGDADLGPLAWIAYQWLQGDDNTLIGRGATIARYLEAYELEALIRAHLATKDVPLGRSIKYALAGLERQRQAAAKRKSAP